MPLQVYIDGDLVAKADAKVSVFDHGLLYGDGVFEGLRVYAGRLFEADAHLRRLYDSAKAIRLIIPIDAAAMRRVVDDTVNANGFADCYVRLIVTRGVGKLGINPDNCGRPSVICIADQLTLYPAEMYERGMAVVTASVIRNHPNALSPRIKSLNYLNNILAKIEAIDAGVPEALMLNGEGNVAECTADNLFVVRDGRVSTPQTSDGILEGVTRGAILRLCDRLSIPARESTLQRQDLYAADECFLTGTGAEVIPVTTVDGRLVGDGAVGPVTRRLHGAFHRLVRGEPDPA